MLLRIVAAVGALLVLLLVAAGLEVARAGSPTEAAVDVLNGTIGQPVSADSAVVPFTVDAGDSATSIAAHLEALSLIRSPLAFRAIVRLEGLGSHLQAGTYDLRRNMSTSELASAIAQGRMAGRFLTIPEGWRIGEIADALEHAGVSSRADFVNFVEQPPVAEVAGAWPVPPGHSLEGFLFPDSYRFERDTPASSVARRMVDDFNNRFTEDLRSQVEANGLTDYQGITLASIVEREAVVPSDRPIVASVYYNRLKRGMKLQSDPTVQYALSDDHVPSGAGYWKGALTIADLAFSSPYNTFQSTGLPPGPICNPGVDSIEAVAHPATTDYLYFVAKPDGSLVFAKTFQEHEQNVARYGS